MKLTPKLLGFTFVGAEWVLWLLIGLSVISLSILLERGFFYYRLRVSLSSMMQKLRQLIRTKDVSGARELVLKTKGIEAQVLSAGLSEVSYGVSAVEDAMIAAKIRVRIMLERNLSFLGTVGSNAPFIGLFGTVLGIIKAFRDLATNQAGGMTVVMAGISEALVATAVGLMVAIPAVVGFNFYGRVVRKKMAEVDATAQDMLALLREDPKRSEGVA